jgi:hypothetical protein
MVLFEEDQGTCIIGHIESASHIEQMSQTWYKDFENRVKKLFSKEYNPYLRTSSDMDNTESLWKDKNDTLRSLWQ